ncbi:hypothetical protein EVAR_22286_1 [Eumeta japonica]|uniref:Uncharacterized protein n=1 Tax=Eumeta variegata TaxID=151549 RepID=A0A4C1UBD9_EUMVA|nr:hypothetical protein EVAR_22286_1 [Eumeta japonica]
MEDVMPTMRSLSPDPEDIAAVNRKYIQVRVGGRGKGFGVYFSRIVFLRFAIITHYFERRRPRRSPTGVRSHARARLGKVISSDVRRTALSCYAVRRRARAVPGRGIRVLSRPRRPGAVGPGAQGEAASASVGAGSDVEGAAAGRRLPTCSPGHSARCSYSSQKLIGVSSPVDSHRTPFLLQFRVKLVR